MAIDNIYLSDLETILSRRHDNGDDFWTTPDRRLLKGSPFSAYGSAVMLLELGMEPSEFIMKKIAEMFFDGWRKRDGRFKLHPDSAILPCHTALAASLLCKMGYADDERIQKTFEYFLDTPYKDGGWRCNKFSFGRGPETDYSNPFPTLSVLDAFRFSGYLNKEKPLDRAVEFLLEHWVIKRPIGPCQYGIGTLFMQVEYPFREYNLFPYVYVLSFYDRAKGDKRFIEAFEALKSKLADGMVVPERVNPKLSKLSFCAKGRPNPLATRRYHEILANLEKKNE